MNKKKNLNLIMGTLAITGVSASSVTTSLANTRELFTKNTSEASSTSSSKYTINWTKKVGAEKEDKFYKVIPTSDKGYIAVGQVSLTATTGFTTGDALIVKYNNKGEEVWRDVVEGDETDRYYTAVEREDGTIVALGTSYSTDLGFTNTNRLGNAISVIYDSNGNRHSIANYTDGNKSLAYKDAVSLSNGKLLAVCAEVTPNIGGDAIEKDTMITDALHTINITQNRKTTVEKFNLNKLNARLNAGMVIGDIITTSDNHVLVSGYEATGNPGDDVIHFVMKMTEDGNTEWLTEEEYSGVTITNSLFESKDGAIYVAGETPSFADVPTQEGILIKLNGEDGVAMWSTIFKGEKFDSFNAVSVDSNGDILVIGQSNSPSTELNIAGDKTEIIMAKYNKEHGALLDIASLGPDTQGITVHSAFQDENGNLIIAGKQGFNTGDVPCDLINPCTQFDAVLLSVKENLKGSPGTPTTPNTPDNCTATTVTLKESEVIVELGNRINVLDYIIFGNGITANDITITPSNGLMKDNNGYYATKAGSYEITIKYDNGCGDVKTLKFTVIFKDPTCSINPPVIKAEDEFTYYIGDNFNALSLITFTGMDTAKIKNSNTEVVNGKTTTTIEYESGDKIVIVSDVDFEKVGSYTIKYTLTNACGESQKEIKVHVKEKASNENNTTGGANNTNKPQTGDNVLVYAGLATASVAGLVLLNSKKENKKELEDDNLE